MRLFLAIILLVLGGCSGTSPAPPPVDTSPHSSLWKLESGTWQEYLILRGKGTFDPQTGCIAPDYASLIPGETNRNTNLAFGEGVARIYSPAGTPVTQVPEKLAGALLERSTGTFIGEAGSYAQRDQTPPEPMITINPIAGESFTVTSTVTSWAGTVFPFTSQYYTKAVNTEIDGFRGAAVTCLVESPTQIPTGYTQVFDGELAEQWYGIPAGTAVDIIFARRVRQGR